MYLYSASLMVKRRTYNSKLLVQLKCRGPVKR